MLEFDVQVTERDERCIVAVAGELDIATAPTLEEALEKAETIGRPLVVDLSATTFVDSTGMSALARAHSRGMEAGRRLIVVCPPDNFDVTRVLDLLGFDQVLDVRGSMADLPTGD